MAGHLRKRKVETYWLQGFICFKYLLSPNFCCVLLYFYGTSRYRPIPYHIGTVCQLNKWKYSTVIRADPNPGRICHNIIYFIYFFIKIWCVDSINCK
jgi:hypothetical protein